MIQTIYEFKAKLHEDLKEEMKSTLERNTPTNYERVLLLLKVAHKLCEVKPLLLEGNDSTITFASASPSATTASAVSPMSYATVSVSADNPY